MACVGCSALAMPNMHSGTCTSSGSWTPRSCSQEWLCRRLAGGHAHLRTAARKARQRWKAQAAPFYSDGQVSNLGVLNAVVEQDPGPDPYAMQRVDPSSFGNRGFYLDPASIGSSLLVLLVLLALSFQRILGLDRLVTSAIKSWKDKRDNARRDEIMTARQRLEQTWSTDGEDNDK